MQKIKSLALSSNELDRGANLPPPPPKIGSTNTPPKIGLKQKFCFYFPHNTYSIVLKNSRKNKA